MFLQLALIRHTSLFILATAACSNGHLSKAKSDAAAELSYEDPLSLERFSLKDGRVLWIPTSATKAVEGITASFDGVVCRPFLPEGIVPFLFNRKEVVDPLTNQASSYEGLVFETNGSLEPSRTRRLEFAFSPEVKAEGLWITAPVASASEYLNLTQDHIYRMYLGSDIVVQGEFSGGRANGFGTLSHLAADVSWTVKSTFWHGYNVGPGVVLFDNGNTFNFEATLGNELQAKENTLAELFTPAGGTLHTATGDVPLQPAWHPDFSDFERVTADGKQMLSASAGVLVAAPAGLIAELPPPLALTWFYSTGFCRPNVARCTPLATDVPTESSEVARVSGEGSADAGAASDDLNERDGREAARGNLSSQTNRGR